MTIKIAITKPHFSLYIGKWEANQSAIGLEATY